MNYFSRDAPREVVSESYVDLYLRQLQERANLGALFNGNIPASEKRKCKARQRRERAQAIMQLKHKQQDAREENERGCGLDELDDDPSDNILKRENRPQNTQVHLRAQRRGTRKFVTTVQNLAADLDLKKIADEMQTTLKVSATVVFSEEFGHVIQLSGDSRLGVKDFLVKRNICLASLIVVH